jgi:hypothetical protein
MEITFSNAYKHCILRMQVQDVWILHLVTPTNTAYENAGRNHWGGTAYIGSDDE